MMFSRDSPGCVGSTGSLPPVWVGRTNLPFPPLCRRGRRGIRSRQAHGCYGRFGLSRQGPWRRPASQEEVCCVVWRSGIASSLDRHCHPQCPPSFLPIRQDRKDKEKDKRLKGQSSHAAWKSEAEMVLRQQYD